MKKEMVLGFAAAVLVAAASIYTVAQTDFVSGQRPSHEQQEGDKRFTNRKGHHRFERIWGRAAKQLELTDAQQAQIKEFVAAERPAVEPLVRELMQTRKEMRQATAGGSFDEALVRSLAAKQAGTVTELIVAKERVQAKIYGVLTAEQRTKVEKLLERFDQRVQRFLSA